MGIDRQQFVQEMRTNAEFRQRVDEAMHRGNDRILESSKQGGYLAVALIAATPIWAKGQDGMTVAILFGTLGVSIVLAAVIHLWVGLRDVRAVSKLHKGTYKGGGFNWDFPAWAIGATQALLILAAFATITYNLSDDTHWRVGDQQQEVDHGS